MAAGKGSGLRLLTRAEILGVDDIATQDVPVPEWGGAVRVRAMSGLERDTFEQSLQERKGTDVSWNFSNMRARMVQMTVIDADGQLLFTDADVEALGKKSVAALQRVFLASQKLSNMRPEDVEKLVGNSVTTQNGAGSTV